MKIVFLALLFPLFAKAAPLFKTEPSTFRLVDATGKKAPSFRALDGSLTKRSLAIAINNSFKLAGSTPTQGYVDVKLEKVIFRTLKKDKGRFGVVLRVSGKEFDTDAVASKADLLAGKTVTLNIPKQEHELGLVTFTTRGDFSMRYDAKADVLWVDRAIARLDIESALTDEDPEFVRFHGKGLRE